MAVAIWLPPTLAELNRFLNSQDSSTDIFLVIFFLPLVEPTAGSIRIVGGQWPLELDRPCTMIARFLILLYFNFLICKMGLHS